MGTTSSLPMYTVEDVPGKGKGLIATKDIPKGTRIISEIPIITSGQDTPDMEQLGIRIYQQLRSLSEDQRREFLSMSNVYTYTNTIERYRGIFRTNALPTGPCLDIGGVFLITCRINHACDANAVNFWNDNLNKITIHAVRDICKGEEIAISYSKYSRNRQARQKELRENFKFTCLCQLCSLPPDQSRDSDSKLDRIHEIDCIIEQAGVPGLVSSPRKMLSYVDEQVRLWGTTDVVGLGRAYPDAFQIAIANGDLARAHVFTERVVPLYLTSMGSDTPDVTEYKELLRDPTTHKYYGMSMKWKTTLDDIPRGLEPSEFEDWLWKRNKEIVRAQQPDLTFLSFDDLPNEHDFEPEYFGGWDTDQSRPRFHWCFLAEIVDVGWSIRLQMTVKDVGGAILPLFFHTSRRGGELDQSQIQKGHTVVVLYAVQHAFMYSDPGIRHETPQRMKIFPLSLDRLQILKEDMQKLSTELDGVRTCHGCGKKGASLKRCGKCSYFWYCDRACQKADWIEKGHKAECKVAKDSDWQAMLQLKWDEFDGHVQFPLRIGKDV
ncbi:SET domain-containing protein [Corynespora cassiicola Philippines]|uniref:SET domain-containing protein n=1 Tax=Corynespora cassiicola Philippines TaxID=1448308 RepID=A0A2T2NE82_CORCC|nr:SET domain-containing protein [Corynespora cassiicola Philippines]